MNDETAAKEAHPFPRSVEAFDEVLTRAQAAKIAAFAVIWVDPNGVVGWKWHFGARPQTDLIGGIECMKHTIISKAMQPVEPAPPTQPDMPDPPTNVRQ